MKKYLRYLNYLLRHKWFVFLECCKEGIVWQGITHDLSKFLPSEFFPYMNHFYGGKEYSDIKKGRDETGYYKPTDTGDKTFDTAWLKHIHRNPHHWQWYVLPENGGRLKILEIPLKYRKEMLCDWEGAHKAQNTKGTTKDWYSKHKNKMQLAPKTREWIEKKLKIL